MGILSKEGAAKKQLQGHRSEPGSALSTQITLSKFHDSTPRGPQLPSRATAHRVALTIQLDEPRRDCRTEPATEASPAFRLLPGLLTSLFISDPHSSARMRAEWVSKFMIQNLGNVNKRSPWSWPIFQCFSPVTFLLEDGHRGHMQCFCTTQTL